MEFPISLLQIKYLITSYPSTIQFHTSNPPLLHEVIEQPAHFIQLTHHSTDNKPGQSISLKLNIKPTHLYKEHIN